MGRENRGVVYSLIHQILSSRVLRLIARLLGSLNARRNGTEENLAGNSGRDGKGTGGGRKRHLRSAL